jgi:hypothetical protein
MGCDQTCGYHFRNSNKLAQNNKLPWDHGICHKHDPKDLEKFMMESAKPVDSGYCLKLFFKFIASSRIPFTVAAGKDLWNLFYALMKLSRDHPDIPIEQLWKHIDRKKFPKLINEDGEINRTQLLDSIVGHLVCLVIDRGKGFLAFICFFIFTM